MLNVPLDTKQVISETQQQWLCMFSLDHVLAWPH